MLRSDAGEVPVTSVVQTQAGRSRWLLWARTAAAAVFVVGAVAGFLLSAALLDIAR
jgi:hypothetical protein